MKSNSSGGFTVVELMISILVTAILLALATPTFTDFLKNRRINAQANELVSSLALARSEALKRVSRVTACKSTNGTSCVSSGDWDQGWIVFNDKNNNAQVNSSFNPSTNEPILRVYNALQGENTLKASTSVADYVSYTASGNSKTNAGAFQSGSFVLCDDRGPGEHSRVISVNVTGRVRVEDSDSDLSSCDP